MEANKDAKLFAVKQGYDLQQRIQGINALAGQQVTVYQVQGQANKIKAEYIGVVEVLRSEKLPDKVRANVLTVVTKSEQGGPSAYFPLTSDKHYCIYLTAKLKRN